MDLAAALAMIETMRCEYRKQTAELVECERQRVVLAGELRQATDALKRCAGSLELTLGRLDVAESRLDLVYSQLDCPSMN